jgi:hypothetical protein
LRHFAFAYPEAVEGYRLGFYRLADAWAEDQRLFPDLFDLTVHILDQAGPIWTTFCFGLMVLWLNGGEEVVLRVLLHLHGVQTRDVYPGELFNRAFARLDFSREGLIGVRGPEDLINIPRGNGGAVSMVVDEHSDPVVVVEPPGDKIVPLVTATDVPVNNRGLLTSPSVGNETPSP